MTAVGTVRIGWQGGEDDFCLAKVGDIFALEEACGAGLAEIYGRLTGGRWKLNDVREPIRLGLMGGGKSADEALKKVKICVDENPRGLAPSVVLAMTILQAVIVGVPDDPLGKTAAPEAATGQVSTMTTAASDAPQSMASAAR